MLDVDDFSRSCISIFDGERQTDPADMSGSTRCRPISGWMGDEPSRSKPSAEPGVPEDVPSVADRKVGGKDPIPRPPRAGGRHGPTAATRRFRPETRRRHGGGGRGGEAAMLGGDGRFQPASSSVTERARAVRPSTLPQVSIASAATRRRSSAAPAETAALGAAEVVSEASSSGATKSMLARCHRWCGSRLRRRPIGRVLPRRGLPRTPG